MQNTDNIRNKIIVEGIGSIVAGACVAGDTFIPLDDATHFGDSGTNYAVVGNQQITHTGKVEGKAGAIVGTNPTPTNPPCSGS